MVSFICLIFLISLLVSYLFYFLLFVTFLHLLKKFSLFFGVSCSLQDLDSWARDQAWAPVGGLPSPDYWTNRDTQTPLSEVSWRSTSQHLDLALPNCLQTPVLEISGQTISERGAEFHPSTENDMTKNMLQRKEQGRKPQNHINEEEIGKLPEKQFKVRILKVIQNLQNRMEVWI